jgi:hypothetical protein
LGWANDAEDLVSVDLEGKAVQDLFGGVAQPQVLNFNVRR